MVDQLESIDPKQLSNIAERATRLMSQYLVPATPNNYAVWFNYALGALPSLEKTIDIIISNKCRFDRSINRDLYALFIEGQACVSTVPEQLNNVIENAQRFLQTAIADNTSHIAALGEVSVEANTSTDPTQIIQKLIGELTNAKSRAATLEDNFAGTSQQLEMVTASLREAEKRSDTDELTGLANRRSLEEFIRSAQIRSMDNEEPLSIFMIDIDHFKLFNDNLGHQIGDQVLQIVSRVLLDGLRDVDIAARYGGEELMAVLPGAALHTAMQVAERVRSRIADARLTKRSTGEDVGKVTVSIGVAEYQIAEPTEEMIERCDRALYQAKRRGRNRTVAARYEVDEQYAAG